MCFPDRRTTDPAAAWYLVAENMVRLTTLVVRVRGPSILGMLGQVHLVAPWPPTSRARSFGRASPKSQERQRSQRQQARLVTEAGFPHVQSSLARPRLAGQCVRKQA